MPWTISKKGQPFNCPSCGEQLRVSRNYYSNTGYAVFVITGGVVYSLGARGGMWLIGVLAVFYPIGMMFSSIARRLWPPNLEVVHDEGRLGGFRA
jgi:hypothetical protein